MNRRRGASTRAASFESSSSAKNSYSSMYRGKQREEEEEGQWRLSDKLYELSLEAEEEEKRQRRCVLLQAEALEDAQSEIARLGAQLDQARDQIRVSSEEARAREKEDDLSRELVVTRAELARTKRLLREMCASCKGRSAANHEFYEEDDQALPPLVEEMAFDGDEAGLRAALSPTPRATCKSDYRTLLNEALLKAAERGHVSICKMLARRGALEARRPPCRRPSNGWTALHAAAYARSAEVVELLASTDACAPQPPENLPSLGENLAVGNNEDPLDLADASGKTALMVAAERKSADAVRALLRAGADAELREAKADVSAKELCDGDVETLSALESTGERFWNASAAGNRAWRRKDFVAALAHFSAALALAGKDDQSSGDKKVSSFSTSKGESSPSAVDLARLELNCAKAALRLGRGLEAGDRADAALERHRLATRGGIYANALAVRAESRESVYNFDGAATDFDDLVTVAEKASEDGRVWRERAKRAREARDATHYAVLGVDVRADDGEIKRAYKRASMRWHPDRRNSRNDQRGNGNNGTSGAKAARDDAARAERHFRRINDAKETLLDSYKRTVYDVENRRRLAAEAIRTHQSSPEPAWPWHRQQSTEPAINSWALADDHSSADGTKRYTRPWKPAGRKDAQKAAAAPSPNKVEEEKSSSPLPQPVVSSSAAEEDAAPPSTSTRGGEEKEEAPADAAVAAPDAGEREEEEDDVQGLDLSRRMRLYEDEIRKQREELEKARVARTRRDEEQPKAATSDASTDATTTDAKRRFDEKVLRRFAKPTNGDEENRLLRGLLDENDDDLATSLAEALGGGVGEDEGPFLARRRNVSPEEEKEELFEDDIGDLDQPPLTPRDLAAQMRDAAEWFDVLDTANKGELEMSHFDELVDRLGLNNVLGEDEMQRQRFFADPVGAGVLRRGAFLGWFAALLEGTEITEEEEEEESDFFAHNSSFSTGGRLGDEAPFSRRWEEQREEQQHRHHRHDGNIPPPPAAAAAATATAASI